MGSRLWRMRVGAETSGGEWSLLILIHTRQEAFWEWDDFELRFLCLTQGRPRLDLN